MTLKTRDALIFQGAGGEAARIEYDRVNSTFKFKIAGTDVFSVDNTGDIALSGVTTLTSSSASTSGSTSVEPLVVDSTMTGAGGVGGRSKFKLNANAALGGWANALKGHTVFGAAGAVTGLGSAVVAELELSAGTVSGSYAPLEIELGMSETAKTGTRTSFMSINAYGHATGLGELDTNGFFFDLNGISIDTGHMVQASAVSGVDSTHALRVQILGVTYYIPLHTAVGFG